MAHKGDSKRGAAVSGVASATAVASHLLAVAASIPRAPAIRR